MVTISPVSPATATVAPSGEATEAFARKPRSPSDRTSPVLTSITRQCTVVPSPETCWTIAVLPSPIGMTLWAGMSNASPRGRRVSASTTKVRSEATTEQAAALVDVRQPRDVAVESCPVPG